MQISAISQNQNFKGIQKTKKGNEYETYNNGKIYGTLLTACDLLGDVSFKNLALLTFGGFVLGAITDNQVNKTRAQDADKFAETGKVSPKTNKCTKISSLIGCGLGTIASIWMYLHFKNSKNPIKTWQKVITPIFPILGAISVASIGLTYDTGVNKFRTKLKQKAKIQNKTK